MTNNDEWSPGHGSAKDVLSAWILAAAIFGLVFVAQSL